MPTLTHIIARLTASAQEVEGIPCVRARRALALLGLSWGHYDWAIRRGKVRAIRRSAPKRWGNSHGVELWWPLDDCILLATSRHNCLHKRPWLLANPDILAGIDPWRRRTLRLSADESFNHSKAA